MLVMLITVSALIILFYISVIKPLTYWNNKRLSYIKPWPLLGSMAPFVFRKCTMIELLDSIYTSFPKERYFGMNQFLQPTLIIRDPDLIKNITVKNFETFPEHITMASEEIDPIFARFLFNISGEEKWRKMRSTVSPFFTSSKLKLMFGLINECVTNFIKYLENQDKIVNIEMKTVFSKLTNDVIGSTAFGITCNSLENPHNDLYLMAKSATNFSGSKSLKMFLYTISPALVKFFKIGILTKNEDCFFRNLIRQVLAIRTEKKVVRPDLINILLEARKNSLKNDKDLINMLEFAAIEDSLKIWESQKMKQRNLSEVDITAQALVFFLAGFETSSTAMSFASYELAVNPEVQEKLRNEVDSISQPTYDALLEMQYMDQVITETLRKWPPITFTDRRSVKPFTIEPELPGEERQHFDKGTVCWIPIHSLQRDPEYYPDPDKFDPERFSSQNKHLIRPFTYLPFGTGPRGCIGSRFALLQAKLVLFHIIKKFEIIPIEKTNIPLVISKGSLFPVAEGGIWLGLKPRGN